MPTIEHNLNINASIDTIYCAIVTETGLKKWLAPNAIARPLEGCINQFKFDEDCTNSMKVFELEFPNYVSWFCADGYTEWIGTFVVFEMIKSGDTTELYFSQINWKEASKFYGYSNYRWGRLLNRLKLLCEKKLETNYNYS